MPGRHRRTFFAAPISTATPNTIYTQQAAKPACQEDIAVHFSQLLLAQLPRTQFTHSKLPDPHASKTSSYIFRISYWHTYSEHSLHTASCQTQCQEDTAVHFSQVLLAQLPRTPFTHSKLPNPHARKTSPYSFRSSYWHSYPQHSLHTASCQIRIPGRHHRNMFASPIGRATPNTVYTQQAAKPAWQEDTNAKISHLRSYWHSYPEHSLHTASCQTRMPGRHQLKIFAPPIGTATPNTVYTQQGAKPACQEDITAICSHLLLARLPPTTFTHSKLSNPHARKTPTTTRRAATLSRSSEYCACHTERSRGPAATRRAATLSRSSEYCACHTERSRAGQRRPGAPQPFLEALSIAPATQTGAAGRRRPGAPQPFLDTDRSREPAATRRAATLSRRSEYCACHTDRSRSSEYCACHTERSRGPAATRRAFLEALSTAPATQRGAAGQRRPGAPQPFVEALSIAPAIQTEAAGQRRPGAPQPFLEALSTAPATQTGAAGQRRPGAPQPFLEALSTAPTTQTGAAGQRRPGALQPFLGSEYCACHGHRRPARRNPF